MEGNTMKMVLFMVAVGVSVCRCSDLEIKKSCFWTSKYTVHVINQLPANSSNPLIVHCASGDDDLGYHILHKNGDFHWSFCENFFFRTLFFCHLWWGHDFKVFNVFDNSIIFHCFGKGGATCNWIARRDGIYFSGYADPNKQVVKKFVWDAYE